jgi:dTDP-4-dehydrorhamnose reductase
VVIHCAAYTAVDRAEEEEEKAFAVNRDGTRNVARACRRCGAFLVTFGTDYVFDGTSGRPYREDDPARPLSAYGRSKWAAEEALREEAPDHLLIRSQWLYGPHGRNFVLAILAKAERGEAMRVVSDQRGCPTYSRDVAAATKKLLDAGARGTFHFSNEGEATWHEFAKFLLARACRAPASLSPVPAAELPYPAPRPVYSVLSKEKYRRTTGDTPRPWEIAAAEFLDNLREGRAER